MVISEGLEAPTWVRSAKALPSGLDLLGLRLPVQTIGGALLDGVTTVTPAVRYIALRAWMIQQYRSHALPDDPRAFTRYAAELECVVVMGSLLQDRSIQRLIGADEALARLLGGDERLEVSPLVKSPAATIYTGPSEQLGISGYRADSVVPVLTKARGVELANSVGRSALELPGLKGLLSGKPPSTMSKDNLAQIGEALRIDQIPEHERRLLVHAIVPNSPMPQELARVASYCALLLLAKERGAMPSERDLFVAACSSARFGEQVLDSAADGWLTYCVRDLIAVCHEAVLEQVVSELLSAPNAGRSGVDAGGLIAKLLARRDEHDIALREIGLLDEGESVTSLTASKLLGRIEGVLGGIQYSGGVGRWTGQLGELRLYESAYGAGAGALSLVVVAWMVAALRLRPGIREALPTLQLASYQGSNRLGIAQIIVPQLDRWLQEDLRVIDIAGQLAYRTVQQHLHIAWARMRFDFHNDVALLTTEDDLWFARDKSFRAGRTASRISQATGWLRQLGLVDDRGRTSDGDEVLRRGLDSLAAGGTQ